MANPTPVPLPPLPHEIDRFWRYVAKQDDGCWLWTGTLFTSGYGAFSYRGKTRRAHRVLYVWTHGEHAEQTLDHLCRCRACVNPDHLQPTSQRENTLRGTTLPAVNARKHHCANGHEFSEENTYYDNNGWRRCRECNRQASRQYLAENRDDVNRRKRERRAAYKVTYEERSCEMCGLLFTPERSTGRYCKRVECINARQRLNYAKRASRH